MAPMEITEGFDLASDFSTDADFSARLQPVPTSGFKQVLASAKALQGAEDGLPTLTKAELVELLFEQVGLNKREAKDIVEAFFAEIGDALERGETVKLTGFGNFQLRDKVSRPGRNPRTGVEVNIPAHRVVTFQPSQKLKVATDESAMSPTVGHDDDSVRG